MLVMGTVSVRAVSAANILHKKMERVGNLLAPDTLFDFNDIFPNLVVNFITKVNIT